MWTLLRAKVIVLPRQSLSWETKRWTPKYASKACLWALSQRCSPHWGLGLEESAGAAPGSTPGVPFAPFMQMGPLECCSAQPEQLYMGSLGESFYPADRPSGERKGEQASSVPYPSSFGHHIGPSSTLGEDSVSKR